VNWEASLRTGERESEDPPRLQRRVAGEQQRDEERAVERQLLLLLATRLLLLLRGAQGRRLRCVSKRASPRRINTRLPRRGQRVQRLGEQHVAPARERADQQRGWHPERGRAQLCLRGTLQPREGVEVDEGLQHAVQRLDAHARVERGGALGGELRANQLSRTRGLEARRGRARRRPTASSESPSACVACAKRAEKRGWEQEASLACSRVFTVSSGYAVQVATQEPMAPASASTRSFSSLERRCRGGTSEAELIVPVQEESETAF